MVKYVRKGECTQCGKCCREICGVGGCQFYIDNQCSIYETRPTFCRVFPEDPDHCIKGCGYYFVDEDDNDRIIEKVDLDAGPVPPHPIHTQEEKLKWITLHNDPLSIKAKNFAEEWMGKIKIELKNGKTLKNVALQTSSAINKSGMKRLVYNMAIVYLTKFWDRGLDLRDWYIQEGYNNYG